MTDALVEFLREQIDTDERIAKATDETEWSNGCMTNCGDRCREYPQCHEVHGKWSQINDDGHPVTWAKHIARHDPARVLAEVDAKRKLIAAHDMSIDPCDAHDVMCNSVPCDVLRLLALPYADRPGYREEWRP